MPSGFVLLLSQCFWILPSWKPALNLVLFVSHNHLQRVLRIRAGCCYSHLELLTKVTISETGSVPYLGASYVTGKQINPQGSKEQPSFSSFFFFFFIRPCLCLCQLLWVKASNGAVSGAQNRVLPAFQYLSCLLMFVTSQLTLAKGLKSVMGRTLTLFIVTAGDFWGQLCTMRCIWKLEGRQVFYGNQLFCLRQPA